MSSVEIDAEIELHKRRANIPKAVMSGWRRGIGVHHAEFHTKFRASVECLFRRKHLQIVFATETLSLGINMPCRTVVMPADSQFFGSIYYRHMVGRAGRRGFDNFGNIVYYGVPRQQVKSFISSSMANIKGCFSLDLDLVLQICVMNCYNPAALTILKSFLHKPLIQINNPSYGTEECKHLLSLQIDYLINK